MTQARRNGLALRPYRGDVLYLDSMFRARRRRRAWKRLLHDLAFLAALALSALVTLAVLGAAVIGLVWVLLAIGRAIGGR